MFIKSLQICTDECTIRDIQFHKGLNLIVDETNTESTKTGNGVGKTTVLRLIDFCLGGKGVEIYSDPANHKDIIKNVRDFLQEKKVVIKLLLFTNDGQEIVIKRNFLKRQNALREINGENYKTDALFVEALEKYTLGLNIAKPSYRQIISHNFRYTNQNVSNVLKTLTMGKDIEYESLYLFLFGCYNDNGAERKKIKEEIGAEEKFKKRLEADGADQNAYKAILGVVNNDINLLEAKKENLNINQNLARDLDLLNEIKYEVNKLTSEISLLKLRENILLQTLEELEGEYSNIDIKELESLYKQAKALVPDLHKTFEELVGYHNQMVANKGKFANSALKQLRENLAKKGSQLSNLLSKEQQLSEVVTQSDTYDDLEYLINEINQKYQRKGELESKIEQIEAIVKKIARLKLKEKEISNDMYTDEFRKKLQDKLDVFKQYFSQVSRKLYNEEYLVKFDFDEKRKIYTFSSLNANLSSGKKMGEISCFDIAYTKFADSQEIPCLHFLLNDKKELMSDNQLVDIAEEVEECGIQFVASILRDKLPAQLNDEKYFVLKLSQQEKLFKLEENI